MPSKKLWKQEDIVFIVENFNNLSIVELSQKINCPSTTIYRKLKELGLAKKNKPPEIGDKIGNLEILDKKTKETKYQNITIAVCKCICGKIIERRLTTITNGKITCCGCRHYLTTSDKKKVENFKHGLTKTNIYKIWAGAKGRCYYESATGYYNYGKKGIKMCEDWKNNFISFYNWSMENGYTQGLTLDRIDRLGDYEPNNCRWVTRHEQSMNTSRNRNITAFGETKTVYDWLLDPRCKVKTHSDIHYRLKAGWEPEKVISQEPRKFNKTN